MLRKMCSIHPVVSRTSLHSWRGCYFSWRRMVVGKEKDLEEDKGWGRKALYKGQYNMLGWLGDMQRD